MLLLDGFNLLKLSQRQTNQVYMLSKMTVPDENDCSEQYHSMQYCEFMEMIGRIAMAKFEGTP